MLLIIFLLFSIIRCLVFMSLVNIGQFFCALKNVHLVILGLAANLGGCKELA